MTDTLADVVSSPYPAGFYNGTNSLCKPRLELKIDVQRESNLP